MRRNYKRKKFHVSGICIFLVLIIFSVAFVLWAISPFFQVAAFGVRYNDTSNPAGKLFTELHKNRPAHWVQTDIIRAPVPVCGGVVWDAAASCFPGQYGWIRVCVEYA